MIHDISFTNSSSLWIGEIQADFSADKSVKQQFWSSSIKYVANYKNLYNVIAAIEYKRGHISGGPFADAVAEETNSAISQYMIGVDAKLIQKSKYSLNGSLIYTHPNSQELRAPGLLSLHDYSRDLAIGLSNNYSIKDTYFSFQSSYIMRFDLHDQMDFKLEASRGIFESLNLLVGVNYHHTFNGLNINDTTYNEVLGNLGIAPFHNKREIFFGTYLGLMKSWSQKFWSELFFHTKVDGRNTNIGQTISISNGYRF